MKKIISVKKRIEMRTTNLFQKIDELGFITDIAWFMNLSRLITNLRLNGLSNNVSTVLGAVSNFDGKSNFKIATEKSYMSKGGMLSKKGQETNVYKLDTWFLKKLEKKINAIKIDTEGEDFKVLLGAKNLIKK